MYTRKEILESILFRRGISKELGKTVPQVKSLRRNYEKGTLKESTALEILQLAGYEIVQEEKWDKKASK
jgi:hypothetical protein